MPRAIRPTELTPDARIDAAKRALADAIDALVEARLAKGSAAREWVDQNESPLGHARHLRLVRTGVLKGVREGKKVLVRRRDIDAYLEAHTVTLKAVEEDDVEGMVAAIVGGRR